MIYDETTVAAISTPLGAGGIGIIRISGPDAFSIAEKVFKAHSGKPVLAMSGYTSALGRIYDGGNAIDDAIIQVFRAPKSYTGENVAELSCHGGIWILQKALRICVENGAVPASPGEFTKRAFLNGKMNLTQAEAVMDLISANGISAAKAALSARDGSISGKMKRITENLTEQSAQLAAWADFPDEDLEKLDKTMISRVLDESQKDINNLLSTYDAGKILREGISVVIAGKPNVGKSTLMNTLLGNERSIVTDIPGTTRDVVEDNARLGDFVLRLSDTAGIRETGDPVESIGVAKSRKQIETGDLLFVVFDSSGELDREDIALLEEVRDKPCIAVINKTDLPQRLDISYIKEKIAKTVMISAKNAEGLKELEAAASELLGLSNIDLSSGIITTERQRLCLIKAHESILDAKCAFKSDMLDAVSACIDYALDELFSLTGERASEHVVNEVFSRFCVGK